MFSVCVITNAGLLMLLLMYLEKPNGVAAFKKTQLSQII